MANIGETQATQTTISPANAGANAQADAHLAARAAADAARQGVEAARQSGHASAEAVRRGADVTADLTRRGTQAGVEAMRRASEGATETVRRGAQAVAQGQRQIAQEAAQTFEQVSRKMAESARVTSEDMQRFFVLPRAAEGGLRDTQQAVAGLIEGVVQTNLRATQELMRLSNPAAVVELQQRFVREYMDALTVGTATLVRAVRRTADEALRPLEEQVQQRHDHRTAAE